MMNTTTSRIAEIDECIAQYNHARLNDHINIYRSLAASWGLSVGRASKAALISALLPAAEKLLIEKATLAATVQLSDDEPTTPTTDSNDTDDSTTRARGENQEPTTMTGSTDAALNRAHRIIDETAGGTTFYLVEDAEDERTEYRCDFQEAEGDRPALFRCTCWQPRDTAGLCEHLRIALAASAWYQLTQIEVLDRSEYVIHHYGAIVAFSIREGIGDTYHSVYLHPGKPEQDRCTCTPVQADGGPGRLCDHTRKARAWEEQYHHERAVYGATVALS